METLRNALRGKKTYLTALVSVLSAIAAYLVGDLSIPEAAQIVLTAVLGATLRSGMTTETTPTD